MINVELNPSDLATIAVIAMFTSMAVSSFIKPGLVGQTGNKYYDLLINTSALLVGELFAFLGMIAAGIEFTTAAIVVTFFRGFSAFFLAVSGYKGYKKIVEFTSKDE